MRGKVTGVFFWVLAISLLLNAFLIGRAAAEECVPQDASTETTGWVTEKPDGKGWYLVDERTVVDEEGYTIPGTEAQHYSYKGGPVEGTPLPPSEDPDSWQANTHLEPHYQGGATPASKPDGTPYVDGEGGLHYTSHQNEGLADWFYFEPGTPDEVVEAVTHQEFKYARDIDAVECDDDKPKPPPNDKPEPPKEYPPLAHTGLDKAWAAGLAVVLASIGSLALWYSRKLRV